MAEGVEGTKACVGKLQAQSGGRTAWQKPYRRYKPHACSYARTDRNYLKNMNYDVAQIKVSTWNPSRLSRRAVIRSATEGCASSCRPRQWQNQGLTSVFPAEGSTLRQPGRFTAKRGSSSWPCRARGKLILFTFNLLFPPLWNLERAKSCNTCIKNKCSRNGPTGSVQQEAFVAWPRGPAAKSNRYAQYSSTYPRITITHI